MPFAKGQSGNPKGRPRSGHSIAELCRKNGTEIVETLMGIVRDEGSTASSRIAAASVLLDRGYGKPPQFSTGDAEDFKKITEMTDDELARVIEEGRETLRSLRAGMAEEEDKKKLH